VTNEVPDDETRCIILWLYFLLIQCFTCDTDFVILRFLRTSTTIYYIVC
jgi:hypothetical protein